MKAEALKERKLRQEVMSRLTAPLHITQNRFEEHHKVEGYFEDRSMPDFLGCDRLYKQDHLYGTVQMGYDPKKAQSFLFANIKTSIFDTAASRDQRRMNDLQRMGQVKTGTQNRAYTSRRRTNSAVLIYKAENKPWSENSIKPYLMRTNMEALRKTLPFLDSAQELDRRAQLMRADRELSAREMAEVNGPGQAAVRDRRRELYDELNELESILWRKQALSRRFFRRLNIAFDLQKQKMFEYYRQRIARRTAEAETAAAAQPEEKKDDDGGR